MFKTNLFKIACVFTVIVSNTYCADYNKNQYDPSNYYKTKKWFEDIEREDILQAEEIKRQLARNNNMHTQQMVIWCQ